MTSKPGKDEEKREDGKESDLEEVGVSLALAVQDGEAPGPCPSDEELASFMDGGLPPGKRDEIMDHLNRCPDCYETWSDVFDFLAEERQARKNKTYRIAKAFAATVALAAACVVLYLAPSGMKNLMKQSYKSFASAAAQMKGGRSATIPDLPWQASDAYLGFAGQGKNKEFNRAFAAGLWSGKRDLTREDFDSPPEALVPAGYDKVEKWDETRSGPLFQFGRWVILVRSACLSDMDLPAGFWNDQLDLAVKFEASLVAFFESEPATRSMVEKQLGAVAKELESATRTTLDREGKKTVETSLDIVTMHFSPDYLAE